MDFSKNLKRAYDTISVIVSPRPPLNLETAQPVARPSAQISSLVDYEELTSVPVLQALVSDDELKNTIAKLERLCPGTDFSPKMISKRQRFLSRYDQQLRTEKRRHEQILRQWAKERCEYEALVIMDQDLTVLRQELKLNFSINGKRRARIDEQDQNELPLAPVEELKVDTNRKRARIELPLPVEEFEELTFGEVESPVEVKEPDIDVTVREVEKPLGVKGRRPRGKETGKSQSRQSNKPTAPRKPKALRKAAVPALKKAKICKEVKKDEVTEEDEDDSDEGAMILEPLLEELYDSDHPLAEINLS